MKKLEAFHFIAFALAFSTINGYDYGDKSIKGILDENTPNVYEKTPKHTELFLSILPLIYILSQQAPNAFEHNILIASYVIGFRAFKSIIAKEENQIGDYLAPFLNSALLVIIYYGMIDTKYIILIYGIILSYSISLVRADKTSISKVMDDFLLTHLVFFYTK